MSVLENKDKLQRLDEVIAANKGSRGAVMRTLQAAQEIFEHVPKDVQIHIAKGLGVTLSEVYGVATFYSQFSLEPRGQFVIGVCLGTACYVKGSLRASWTCSPAIPPRTSASPCGIPAAWAPAVWRRS